VPQPCDELWLNSWILLMSIQYALIVFSSTSSNRFDLALIQLRPCTNAPSDDETLRLATRMSGPSNQMIVCPACNVGIPVPHAECTSFVCPECKTQLQVAAYRTMINAMVAFLQNVQDKNRTMFHLLCKSEFVGVVNGFHPAV
jgi:uncharacterized protein YbaR (Trm112 family)